MILIEGILWSSSGRDLEGNVRIGTDRTMGEGGWRIEIEEVESS